MGARDVDAVRAAVLCPSIFGGAGADRLADVSGTPNMTGAKANAVAFVVRRFADRGLLVDLGAGPDGTLHRPGRVTFEQRLQQAVTGRAPHEPLIPALRREIQALVRHCTADSAAPIWRMVDAMPALREYEETMRLRHAQSPATAIAADLGLPRPPRPAGRSPDSWSTPVRWPGRRPIRRPRWTRSSR